MNIVIERATASDADAIVRLVHELAESSGGTADVHAAYVRSWLAFPGRTVLLAAAADGAPGSAAVDSTATGERIGLLAFSLNPNLYHAADGCLIEDLYVRPAWRGKGVGRALVAWVMDQAARQGWAEVSVSTGRENGPALSLYRGLGLVEEYVLLEKHYGDG